MLTILTVAAGIVALFVAGFVWQAAAEARLRRATPPGRFVEVDGRRMHLREKGDAAGPTIVIEQGAGGASFHWWTVQDQIARFARVVTYDRAGYGWSDAAPAGRSIAERVHDLHSLLHAAEVPGPYVLVGHSYGGPMIALFARDHRAETAGLVFADTPDMTQILGPQYQTVTRKMHLPFMRVMRFATRCGLMRLWAALFPERTLFSGLAPEPRAAALLTRRTAALDAAIDDLASLWTVPDTDRLPLAPGSLGNMPLGVISHGVQFPGAFGALEEGFPESQTRLLALSANSLQVHLPEAGHLVQHDAPDAVVETVRRVWEAARDGAGLQPVLSAA